MVSIVPLNRFPWPAALPLCRSGVSCRAIGTRYKARRHMDPELAKQYALHKILDFLTSLGNSITEVHQSEDSRLLFVLDQRPFEVLFWIEEDSDMLCVTTSTGDTSVPDFEHAVAFLRTVLETCWHYCVSVMQNDSHPEFTRYDLSMALFFSGINEDTFEQTLVNLSQCAEAIEKHHQQLVKAYEAGEPWVPAPQES
jgi:hypothetical protein